MNLIVKRRWLTALRSGKYRQGIGVLHRRRANRDEYCCLGVLCQLALDAGINIKTTNGDYGAVLYDGFRGSLPRVVREWAGIASTNPSITTLDSALTDLNDGGQYSFKHLADVIEENL